VLYLWETAHEQDAGRAAVDTLPPALGALPARVITGNAPRISSGTNPRNARRACESGAYGRIPARCRIGSGEKKGAAEALDTRCSGVTRMDQSKLAIYIPVTQANAALGGMVKA
jgi:hypothetical protein